LVEILAADRYRLYVTGRGTVWTGPGVWQRADLLDPVQRAALIRSVRPDLLVHCAWETRPGYFPDAPENLDWVGASLDLLRLFAAEGGRRAILIGSGAEYGAPPTQGERAREADRGRPHTLYGQAKLALTETALASSRALGIEILCARLFDLFGPGDSPAR